MQKGKYKIQKAARTNFHKSNTKILKRGGRGERVNSDLCFSYKNF